MSKNKITQFAIFLFLCSCSQDRILLKPLTTSSNTTIWGEDQNVKSYTTKILSYNKSYFFDDGSSIYFPNNSLVNKNGDPIELPIEVYVKAYLTPADLIYHRLPTVANGGKLLETAGVFEIRGFKGNEEVFIKKGSIFQINVANTLNTNFQNLLFKGERGDSLGVDWQTTTDTSLIIFRGNPELDYNIAYTLFPNSFGFWNIDKFVDSTEITTETTISKPNFEGNLVAFLFFKDRNSVMTLWFEKPTIPVPLGDRILFILVGKTKEDEYYADFQDLVISDKMNIVPNLKKAEYKDIKEKINSLEFSKE